MLNYIDKSRGPYPVSLFKTVDVTQVRSTLLMSARP